MFKTIFISFIKISKHKYDFLYLYAYSNINSEYAELAVFLYTSYGPISTVSFSASMRRRPLGVSSVVIFIDYSCLTACGLKPHPCMNIGRLVTLTGLKSNFGDPVGRVKQRTVRSSLGFCAVSEGT